MRWHTPRHPGTEIRDAIDAAKTAAKAALEKKESQEAVDAANTALADAMKKLAVAGDQTDLRKVLDQAKALNENDYTAKAGNMFIGCDRQSGNSNCKP